MPSVLLRNVPEGVLEKLKRRAKDSRRSLQQELLTILELAAAAGAGAAPADRAALIRQRLAASGHNFGDSTVDIGEDRDR